MKKYRKYIAFLFFVSLAVIYLLSIAPAEAMPRTNDKLNHIAGFFYLSFLGKFLYKNVYIFLGLLFYGILIEISQLFVPGRSCEFNDVVADCIGISLGILVFSFFRKEK
ncbi:VanZ family protein [Desulfurobacterium atlanticum]|uniref:VanZ like family protein n=1 Tax=Desulfurobacterium atlanticum TaxID=240169 RepID=A0A238ZYV4_9BACT|nr:VanZ family protein [Desulfurobacterium atlanticum]SNR88191.1 VanZ like family protein [Desulfurobacterium atlanticum]